MICPSRLRRLLDEGASLALLDVREHGEYNLAHIPGASSLPRRLLESNVGRLVPWRGAQVVVCDDDGRRAVLAARTLGRMGYTRIDVLEGGVNRWASENHPTEWGMNVPSKEFGERIEVRHHVPTIEARELEACMRRGDDLVILDTRTPEEYGRHCIPGGRSLPGGELPLRVTDIAAPAGATIVVNCAGRTRSIIGARVLQRMGLPNVVSLKNGTSGWVLAGLELEQGADRLELPEPSPEGAARAETFARRVADEDGVRLLDVKALRELMARAGDEAVYLVDVRTEPEFTQGHIPGFWSFPGGQAVQRSDDVVAVHDAQVVFCCDSITRAAVAASWYRQMGFPHVYAVDGGVRAWTGAGLPLESGPTKSPPFGLREATGAVPAVSPADLQSRLQAPGRSTVLFVDTSRAFAAGHVAGARWLPRGWLELQIDAVAPDREAQVIVTDQRGDQAPLAAVTLRELGYADVAYLAGGMAAWRSAGLPIEQGLSGVMEPPDDIVPAGSERSSADMIQYLRWEVLLGRKYEQE
jgi:rhodanese-related sulfurtransferase